MIRYIGSHKKVWFILLIDEQIGGGVVLICPSPTPWTLKLFFHHIIRPPPFIESRPPHDFISPPLILLTSMSN